MNIRKREGKEELNGVINVHKSSKTDGDIDGNAKEEDEESSEVKQTGLVAASQSQRSSLLRQASQRSAYYHQ